MQGLADGYFILPYTIGHYLATARLPSIPEDHAESRAALHRVTSKITRLLSAKGRRTAASFHREIGTLLWNHCGMSRDEAGLKKALTSIPTLREEFWKDVMVPGSGDDFNQELEYAGRWRTILSLQNCSVTTPCIARNHVERIFAKNIRRMMVNRSATTPVSPTWPPGNTEMEQYRSCTRSP